MRRFISIAIENDDLEIDVDDGPIIKINGPLADVCHQALNAAFTKDEERLAAEDANQNADLFNTISQQFVDWTNGKSSNDEVTVTAVSLTRLEPKDALEITSNAAVLNNPESHAVVVITEDGMEGDLETKKVILEHLKITLEGQGVKLFKN